jgi:hypothetical protein
MTAGPDEVRLPDPYQTIELLSPDNGIVRGSSLAHT